MEIGYDGAVLSGEGEVERSAFCIHAPIHRLVPQHACVLHTHMPFASAPERKVLVMANHGILACGKTVAEAYDLLYHFERACQVQLYAMWTGRPLKEVPAHIVARTLRQYAASPSYGGKPACEHHFAALKRLL